MTDPSRIWYLAICRGCGTGNDEMPFSIWGDRNEWAAQHVAATGHVVVTTQTSGTDEPASGGWCAPAHVTCVCGAVLDAPGGHSCSLPVAAETLHLPGLGASPGATM